MMKCLQQRWFSLFQDNDPSIHEFVVLGDVEMSDPEPKASAFPQIAIRPTDGRPESFLVDGVEYNMH
jgi:hypothetical protein